MQMHMLEQARRNAREQATRAFSFDVFDTFVLRRCTTPDGVFERACHHGPLPRRRGLVETFVQHRIQAEARAHHRALREGGSAELAIEDIYRLFPFRLFGLARDDLPALVEAEFAAELDLCFANPDMVRLYDDLRASGIRVGFISDTYWSEERLARLLRNCRDGLQWDFLYASCRHGTGKSEALFGRYLADQGLAPDAAIHIGDNVAADIAGAQRHGIRTIHCPQAGVRLAGVFARESAIAGVIGPGGRRLDRGLRTARRLIAVHAPARSAAFALGVDVVGPVMTGFGRFVADRVARLAAPGRRVAVAFLARDAWLPLTLWQRQGRAAAYVEVNRRTAMVAGATDAAPLVEFFDKVPEIDAKTFGEILKAVPPRVAAFFRRSPGGVVAGRALAKALPSLIDAADLARLSADMRGGLMAHLRTRIPEFATLTDLVLVDLGYSGTVQKALRRVFDLEQAALRLHGLYLLTADDEIAEIADDDSAEGFISGFVVPPHVKRTLLRNVVLLEHLCAASEGSVRCYRGGEVVREADPRPAEQGTLCADAQEGARYFAGRAAELAAVLDPYADPDDAAHAVAGVLARFLLLPTDDELALLGGLRHDVNLGTQTTVPMSDGEAAADLEATQALPTAFVGGWPPMWLAGSMAALSPAHGFLYALFGAGALPADVFGDAKCGTVEVALVCRTRLQAVQASCFRTGFGDVRIKLPVLREFAAEAIALPLATVASEGLLKGATLQAGDNLRAAMFNRKIDRLPPQSLHGSGLAFRGRHYVATAADGRLVIALPPARAAVMLVTVTLTPLTGRVLALAPAADESGT